MKKITSGRIPPAGSSPITEQDFRCRMTASLLAILTCLAVMASSAFALFHTEVSSASNTLQSAHYTVQVTSAYQSTPYVTRLAQNDQHIFTIEAKGTASTGYCIVQVGNQVSYTPAIPHGETLTLEITAAAGVQIAITPVWGTPPVSVYSRDDDPFAIVHSTTPHATYTVEATATLANIAEHYGVDEADILIYNGITEIAENMPLKIPGVDSTYPIYVAPVETQQSGESDSMADAGDEGASDNTQQDNSEGATQDGEPN